jgi:hypothetical protein
MKKLLVITPLILILLSCNKEKRYSTKLLKGEAWRVVSVTIDGQISQFGGQWKIIEDQDIYEAPPTAAWLSNNEDAVFEWQFQEKGDKFQLNYLQLCEESTGSDLDSLDYFVYGITGNYDVKRHKKKEMEFRSSATIEHFGKEVVIKIKKQ